LEFTYSAGTSRFLPRLADTYPLQKLQRQLLIG
jgi:hypothetical protein